MKQVLAVCGGVVASILLSTSLAAAEPAAPPAPAVSAATPAEPDRMQETVCRREKETGSLVKAKKTCHTRAQWAYIDDTNQAFSRDLVDSTRTRPGGN